jgi:peroxiredoxin
MRRKIPSSVFLLGIVAAAAATFWLLGTFAPGYGTAVQDQKFRQTMAQIHVPAIQGTTVDGQPFHLSDYKGKVVLLNLWSTSCGPCRMETPELEALQKQFSPRGFTVVGLSEDSDAAPVKAFMHDQNVSYPMLLATSDNLNGIVTDSIPTSYLIDRNGTVTFQQIGVPEDLKAFHEMWISEIQRVL